MLTNAIGKTFDWARRVDVVSAIDTVRYYAGWAGKNQGKTIETNEATLVYTRHEPKGVVGQIIPWNFPLLQASWKIAPCLAAGNSFVLKPAELTPHTAILTMQLLDDLGLPKGVGNLVLGSGASAGAGFVAAEEAFEGLGEPLAVEGISDDVAPMLQDALESVDGFRRDAGEDLHEGALGRPSAAAAPFSTLGPPSMPLTANLWRWR